MVIVVVICLAIVSFLLQDAFFGKSSFFRHSTSIGKVDGEEMDVKEFEQKVQLAENAYRTNVPNGAIDEQTRQAIREQVWNQFVSGQILNAEFDKLGIGFTAKELNDLTMGKNPHPEVKRQFTNPQTGQFDPQAVVNFVRSMGQDPTGRAREQWRQFEDYLKKDRMQNKFLALIRQAIYYPKWMAEKFVTDQNTLANISYVLVPYSNISDSTVKVTEAELQQYLNEHKAMFKQEESRKIEYVSFDAIPSAADSVAALRQLESLKAELAKTPEKEIAAFIGRNSEVPYYDGYISVKLIQVPKKDSIINLSVGQIFGPYFDNTTVVYAKMIDKKTLPDSAKVRHILISTQALPDSVAKARIDSIEKAIRQGADFATLAAKYSDDPGSKNKGGVYDYFPQGQMLKAFNDFSFEGKKGEMKVVKTQAGYHLIEILDQKNFSPAVKVAYLGKKIEPSQETDSKAFNAANEFAGRYHDLKHFENAIQEKGLNKRIAENIRPNDYVIPGIGQARELVRWAYDAEKGEVSNVFTFEDKYVVAVLTGIYKEGTADLAEVRPQVEAAVKKQKKAALIASKIKGATTLDAVAKSYDQIVAKATGVNFNNPIVPNLGFEPKVVGAAFNKTWSTSISAPIYGNNGVYVIKVDAYLPQPSQAGEVTTQRTAQELSIKASLENRVFDALRKQTKIVDNRAKFY